MKSKIANQNDFDDAAWANRGDYWLKQLVPASSYRDRIRRTLNMPLILSGHGVKLRVDRGTLLVRCGFTHYPQEREEWRFFPKDRRLPSRIVILDGDGGITFDAIEWLATQGVQLVQINWRGEVISVGGGFGYSASPEIVAAQNEILRNGCGSQFANYLIGQKIDNCTTTIKNVFPASPAVELTLKQLNFRLENIRKNPLSSRGKLLGEEGMAANIYFRCWHSRSLRWRGISRKPIPDDWHRIGPRMSGPKGNQFARHPVNAILNYCYAVLQNQVQTIIIAAGFDPSVGYIHSDETKNKPKLVFDLMEPLRPVIDRKVLEFAQSHIFSPGDFVTDKMGICKLHPQFARLVVKLVQDIQEVESISFSNLKKLLALYPAPAKKAGRNVAQYRTRLIGRQG